jgi:hypothetical protein
MRKLLPDFQKHCAISESLSVAAIDALLSVQGEK